MKKLLALAAVAAMGISVVGATPQTSFNKGEFQVDLGAMHTKADAGTVTEGPAQYASNSHWEGHNLLSDYKWNFQGGLTYALGNKTAIQYAYTGLNTANSDFETGSTAPNEYVNRNNQMHEVNLIQSLGKNVAVYGGWARISGDYFDGHRPTNAAGSGFLREEGYRHVNNIAQLGLIAKAPIGHKLEVYGKAGIGTKNTTTWEAGLGYHINRNADLNVGYKYINTKWNDWSDKNITFKGLTAGLSLRFGGHSEKPVPAPTPTPAPVVETPAPMVQKADYYTTSIYFDSDVDTPRADQAGHLSAALNAANQYPNDIVKVVGNADSSYTHEYNQGLSERRVQSVAQYLVNNGVSANRLVGLANGDWKPVADNATPAGRAENRRVDVFVNHK